MRILAFRPEPYPGPVVARFDAEVSPDCRLYNLQLKRTGAGDLRVVAANLRGQHSATFSVPLGRELTAAAVAALSTISKGAKAHDEFARA